jgi:hypothetical protein
LADSLGVSKAAIAIVVVAVNAPVAVPAGGSFDLLLSLLFALALVPIFLIGHSLLGRTPAAVLLSAYMAFIGYRMLPVG